MTASPDPSYAALAILAAGVLAFVAGIAFGLAFARRNRQSELDHAHSIGVAFGRATAPHAHLFHTGGTPPLPPILPRHPAIAKMIDDANTKAARHKGARRG